MAIDDTKIGDAESEIEQPAFEQPAKKRGRKSGTTTQKPTGTKKEKISARQLTGILYLGHATAADALNTPDLSINEDEAGAIAAAVVDVLQYYDFEASAKTLAWCNLFGTLATVYGVKVYSILNRAKDAQHD